jgi:type I restriction enzyme R subunit
VEVLTKYYEIFKAKQADRVNKLKIATIFTYTANEDDADANGLLDNDIEITTSSLNKHTRDNLEEYIKDYNEMFGTNYTTKDSKSFYNYYRDIADRVKKKEIDLLLVVNMFLTGFDSKELNTLYVDKNLKFHGLIQAYSRTNRILNEKKSQGNIVSFRNLKKATDDAVALFSNKDAKEIIFLQPFEVYLKRFNDALADLQKLAPTPSAVDDLFGEKSELEFVLQFREIMRLKNILESFSDFSYDSLGVSEQEYEDYKSKYLDIYDKVRNDHEKEKVSILDDVDFELELVRRDEVNVDYIIRLLAKLVDAKDEDKQNLVGNIINTLNSDPVLRSKRELIEQFIEKTIPNIKDSNDVEVAFDDYWSEEKTKAYDELCTEENLKEDRLQNILDSYLYTGRKPRNADIAGTLKKQPTILRRKSIVNRVADKLNKFIETFFD